MVYQFSMVYTAANVVFRIIAFVLVFFILNRWINPSYKLAWCIMILIFPIGGMMVYFLLGRKSLTKRARARLNDVHTHARRYLQQEDFVAEKLQQTDASIAAQSHYIDKWGGYPCYLNSDVTYYKSGEEMFPDILEALREAKEYIFIEFFIIEPGIMWNSVLEILREKVSQGVLVRVMYDDVGCVSTLPTNYDKKLREMGIECCVFNRIYPIVSILMNNRDHRKVLVCDGKVGFTGGVNLADEYINEKERFGYWKDTGVRVYGDAVWNFVVMFLENWHYMNRTIEDFSQYLPKESVKPSVWKDGFVQPYADSPLDAENVGETIYFNMINKAKRYVYICTPYLLIDNEMIVTLCTAAKSGIDVRIIMPGVPDKKIVYAMAQASYQRLIENGVKIYQFIPGFLHAKMFVCDDEVATVGSVNMDYRSFYLHFENGLFFYKSHAVKDVYNDFMDMLDQSEEITLDFCMKRNWFTRMFLGVMNIFSPLL
jgi:cardiolipin synthase